MESQNSRTRRRISEELARSEIEAMERDARDALFYQNNQFHIVVREYQRQARDAVSQAVQESSESYEVMRTEEIQSIQNRYEGRMEENEKRVAHLIGSEAQEALRGQRNHLLQDHEMVLQSAKEKKKFLRSQMRSEMQSQVVSFRRVLHDRIVQPEHILAQFSKRGTLMMTSVKEIFLGSSENERQTVTRAQETAAFLQNEMSQATTACDS